MIKGGGGHGGGGGHPYKLIITTDIPQMSDNYN